MRSHIAKACRHSSSQPSLWRGGGGGTGVTLGRSSQVVIARGCGIASSEAQYRYPATPPITAPAPPVTTDPGTPAPAPTPAPKRAPGGPATANPPPVSVIVVAASPTSPPIPQPNSAPPKATSKRLYLVSPLGSTTLSGSFFT